MLRRLRFLATLLALSGLVVAACSSPEPETQRAIVPVLETTTTVAELPDETAPVDGPAAGAAADFVEQAPAESLLLVQSERRSGDVLTLTLEVRRPDGTVVTDLTDAANGRAWQPTWSNDGRWVAFAYPDEDEGWQLGVSSWDGEQQNSVPLGGPPEYLLFSFDDQRVYASLATETGVGLASFDPFTGAAPQAITAGRPLFFDQAPSGALAVRDAEGVYVVDPVDPQRSQLLAPASLQAFNTPRWASDPVAIFGVVEFNGEQVLSMIQVNADTPLPLAPVTGPVTIDAVVDEALVAIIVNDPDGGRAEGALGRGLHVIDLAASEFRELDADVIGAPLISPDGQWIAGATTDETGRRLVVHHVDGTDSVATPPYEASPSPLAIAIDRFYDQYSMAQSVFAPDSSAIAFTGIIGDERGVFVQSLDGGDPVYAGEGDVVWWSPT